jgi:hypothetical protein
MSFPCQASFYVYHSINLGHRVQLQHPAILSRKPSSMDRIVREVTWDWAPSKRHEQAGWLLSGNLPFVLWNTALRLHYMTAYLCSPGSHAGPCSLPLLRHKICPFRALTSPPPWCPGFLHQKLLPHFPRVTDSLFLICRFPVQHTFPPRLFPRPSRLLLLSPTGSLGGRITAQRFYSILRWANGNWGPHFHFLPASYIIQNVRPDDYCDGQAYDHSSDFRCSVSY